MTIQRVHSKWAKTKALLKSNFLTNYIPVTKRFHYDSVYQMLHQYGMVYIKPNRGTFGLGVIRAEHTHTGYTLQFNRTKLSYAAFSPFYQKLRSLIGQRTYLVQKGIHLLRHKNRRFDLRVMVQKNNKNEWESTGVIGRLSHPAKIVTNYHSGGTIMPIERLMSGHMNASQLNAFVSRLKKLGLFIADQMQKSYPGIKELGVDIAVDEELHPWILEVNTMPDPFIFRKLSDKRVFNRIYGYARRYGRFKA